MSEMSNMEAVERSPLSKDIRMEISKGNVPGHTPLHKFGQNPDTDKTSVPEDLWDGGGIYVPPTANRTHDIASTSTQDAGTLVSAGNITSFDSATDTITVTGATFQADGVAAGDTFLNDANQDHSIILTIPSETTITVEPMHHNDNSIAGHAFRIATAAGTGAVVVHIKLGDQKDGTQLTEFIILNGTTNVPTLNEYYRITRKHTHGVGSNGVAVGDIKATAQTDGTVTSIIQAGAGSTQMAFTHVPRGSDLLLTSWWGSIHRTGVASDAMSHLSLYSKLWAENSDGLILRDAMPLHVGGGIHRVPFDFPLEIAQDEDLWIRIEDVSDDNSIIFGGFDGVFVKHGF